MKTLTAANSVILLSVQGLFNTPVQLQGYAADDVFDIEDLTTAETMMGVDGKLSAGWVPQPIVQNFTLQADSDSVTFFEQWYQAQQRVREVYAAAGSTSLPSVGRKYTMRKGILTKYAAAPNGKKVLQPRRFTVTWEAIAAAPF